MRTLARRGFTLLELLTVLCLIAIAAGLILPCLARTHCGSNRTTCASNLNQIAKAMFMYADVPANETFPNFQNDPMQSWGLLYNKYVLDNRCFSCPSRPTSPTELQNMKPGDPIPKSCAFGYDPNHSPNDAVAPIAADMAFNGKNSNNHGANVGQYVMIGAGTIEFRDTSVYNFGDGKTDPDIFGLNPELPRSMDGYIRQ